MIFDLEKKKAVRFEFPGGGWVELKAPTVDDFVRINKATTEYRPFLHEAGGRTPRVLTQEIPDTDKQAFLYNDCAIVAWGDFFDRNGKEIPCTPENKTVLMRLEDPTFRDFVTEKLKALGEAEKTAQEETEKN